MGSEFVVLGFLAAAAFTIFNLIRYRHIEQMSKIEHGLNEEDKSSKKSDLILNIGIILTALGLAIFTSYLASVLTDIPDHITMPGCILLFGGLGFLISHAIQLKRKS